MRSLTLAVKKLTATKKIFCCFLLLMLSLFASAQEKTVSGVVKNPADGSPIGNASVQVKGTKSGTFTNDQGAYSIKVNGNQTLVISAIGFSIVEIKVGSQTSIDVEMININGNL